MSPRPGAAEPNGGPSRWVSGLVERGHEVRVVAPGRDAAGNAGHGPARSASPGPLGAAALEARLTAATLRAAAARRIGPGRRRGGDRDGAWHLAHVVLHPGSFGLPRALQALRIPVVVEVDGPLVGADEDGLGPALHRETLRAAIRGAAAVIAPEARFAAELDRALGVRGARVIEDGLDPAGLEPMDPGQAKRELGLLEAQRFFALTARLDDRIALEPLMFAHRKIAGAGLLVVGSGPREDAVAAMAVATRPSSPVLLLEDRPEARRRAIAAADIGLTLNTERPGPTSRRYAALGRRQVAFDHPDLDPIETAFSGETPVLRAPTPPPRPAPGPPSEGVPGTEDLRAAMAEALAVHRAQGPLSAARVAAFRAEVAGGDRVDRLLALYREVTGVEGN